MLGFTRDQTGVLRRRCPRGPARLRTTVTRPQLPLLTPRPR